jgi:hypothetical protein
MQKGTFTNVNNDTSQVDLVQQRRMSGVDTNAREPSTSTRFARRQTYIGLHRPTPASCGS